MTCLKVIIPAIARFSIAGRNTIFEESLAATLIAASSFAFVIRNLLRPSGSP